MADMPGELARTRVELLAVRRDLALLRDSESRLRKRLNEGMDIAYQGGHPANAVAAAVAGAVSRPTALGVLRAGEVVSRVRAARVSAGCPEGDLWVDARRDHTVTVAYMGARVRAGIVVGGDGDGVPGGGAVSRLLDAFAGVGLTLEPIGIEEPGAAFARGGTVVVSIPRLARLGDGPVRRPGVVVKERGVLPEGGIGHGTVPMDGAIVGGSIVVDALGNAVVAGEGEMGEGEMGEGEMGEGGGGWVEGVEDWEVEGVVEAVARVPGQAWVSGAPEAGVDPLAPPPRRG
jgi:hypothetical protein